MKQQINIKIDPSIKPIFADEVQLICALKQDKREDGFFKEGNLSLIFFDNFTRKAVSRIVLNLITAKQLTNVLIQNIKSLEKEMDSKEETKKEIINISKGAKPEDYIG